jgi:hypothetical protein
LGPCSGGVASATPRCAEPCRATLPRPWPQAACTSLNWLSNLAVGLAFAPLLRALGLPGTYALFACTNAGAAAFIASRVVETKRQSLEQIQALLVPPAGPAEGPWAGEPP